jgi:arylsulfatase A-like enzyme
MTDDQGWGDVGYYGNPHVKTPNIDDMAKSGMRFDRYYSVGPVCSPTRAVQLTGRAHDRMGITYANRGHLPEKEITIAELARDQGYATGHFGKWHLGALSRTVKDSRRGGPKAGDYSPPSRHGYDTYFCTEARTPTYWPEEGEYSYGSFMTRYWTADEVSVELDDKTMRGDDSKIIMNRALSFVDDSAKKKQPFLAVCWFHSPHTPVVQDPNYPYDQGKLWPQSRAYYSSITGMDVQVGRLRTRLRELGIADSTMVLFTSDNGPTKESTGKQVLKFAAKGDPDGNGGEEPIALSGGKGSIAEGGIRVPGIIEWPGRITPGVCNAPASNYDLLPTLLDIWDKKMPGGRHLDGGSIAPLLFDGATSRPGHVINIFFQGKRAAIGPRFKAVAMGKEGEKKGWSLYDIPTDHGEHSNVADQHPELVTRMQEDFTKWVTTVKASRAGKDYK